MHREIVKDNKKLKGFAAHGVRFVATASSEKGLQGVGHCPLCGKQGHFYVNATTRQWACHGCGLKGGFGAYLEAVAKKNALAARGKPMLTLAQDRGLKPSTLRRWGLGHDAARNQYTTPVWGPHTLMDLRTYKMGGKGKSTPGATVWLVGYERLEDNPTAPVWLCEGEWDAEAMDEILIDSGEPGIALGVTGADTFKAEWVQSFQGRDVVLVYDHDDAGIRGEVKAWTKLQGIARSVRCMHWPEELPGGFDIRDLYYHLGGKATSTLKALQDGLQAQPRAHSGMDGAAAQAGVDAPAIVTLDGAGLPRSEVVAGYRKWMHLPNPEGLDVLFGTALGNRLPGDPLWMFLVAPPGGSKSELLMSLGTSPLMMATTSLTPHALVSGAMSPGGGDPSLIPKLDGKCLIIKDFTTILGMNHTARDEILGVLRDAYDGETTKYFGTGLVKSYRSTFGIIAGVTPAIEMFTTVHASLGERFLRYRLRTPGRIAIGSDIIERAIENIAQEVAMRGQLQEVAAEALGREVNLNKLPKIPAPMRKKLVGLAQWVASTRAVVVREKYTREMMFKPVAEIGTRLAKQLGKLAIGLGLWYQTDTLTEEHYQVLVKVARDTIPDRVEEVLRILWVNGGVDDFLGVSKVSDLTRLSPETCRTLLQDLTTLHVLQKDDSGGMGGRFRVAPAMARVMRPLGIYKEEERWKKLTGEESTNE